MLFIPQENEKVVAELTERPVTPELTTAEELDENGEYEVRIWKEQGHYEWLILPDLLFCADCQNCCS